MKKLSVVLLAVVMLLTVCMTSVSAAGAPKMKAALSSAELTKSAKEQTVSLTVSVDAATDMAAFNFSVTLPNGFKVTKVASADSNIDASDLVKYSNLNNGYISWVSADCENYNVTKLAVLTISVPANTAVGEYTISISKAVASKDYGSVEIWATGNSDVKASATLKVVAPKEEPSKEVSSKEETSKKEQTSKKEETSKKAPEVSSEEPSVEVSSEEPSVEVSSEEPSTEPSSEEPSTEPSSEEKPVDNQPANLTWLWIVIGVVVVAAVVVLVILLARKKKEQK